MSDFHQNDLNPAMGGILIQRMVPGDEQEERQREALALPRLLLNDSQVLDVENIAHGTFSPLTGFMGSNDYEAVLSSCRLASGIPFSVPILLSFPKTLRPEYSPGKTVLLWNEKEDAPCALLEIQESFTVDLKQQAEMVYGTEELEHPGVKRMWDLGPHCLAGPITLLRQSESLIPKAYDLKPLEVREQIRKRGWNTVTGFQTRNLGHKAHEHLQKIGLELTDGLLIHPLIGWKKKGDMLPDVILKGYEILVDRYYPKERVMLSGLTTAMRYAGPREALFHAVIRKNFGCTHFIVGRDHAGVGGYYEKYAAHRMFDQFRQEELGITPLRLHGPCYCQVCDEIVTEAICPHGPDGWMNISGTDVRALIAQGKPPSPKIMRPEISEFLIRKAQTTGVFFDG